MHADIILAIFKYTVVAFSAGIMAGYTWVMAQTSGADLTTVAGAGGFIGVTLLAAWRLLKDNRLASDLDRLWREERERNDRLQRTVNAYMANYGPLPKNGDGDG